MQLCLFVHVVEKQHLEEGVKRKRGTAKSVCPYYKASALQQMRDDLIGTVHDIEQLVKLGREIHACPYYGTRLAIPPAQVVSFLLVLFLHPCVSYVWIVCAAPIIFIFQIVNLYFCL